MDPAQFTVGWICALPREKAASIAMFDETYDRSAISQPDRDTNVYSLGRIARHKIVLTLLKSAGTNQAVSATSLMRYTFPNLRFMFMVGIGGGVPSSATGEDVRLGDVVVSMPWGSYPGVIQYDYGKFLQTGVFERTGALQPPPDILQNAVKSLMAKHESQDNCIRKYIEEMLIKFPRLKEREHDYSRPDTAEDRLYNAEYIHAVVGGSCADCDQEQLVYRPNRPQDQPVIHYGTIASGNGVIRDALKRDQLGKDFGVMCVEMEAAGMMDGGQSIVVRGICDYSDTHKNKEYQRHAAAVAAACAKELLMEVPSKNMEGVSRIPYSRPSNQAKDIEHELLADSDPDVSSQSATSGPPVGERQSVLLPSKNLCESRPYNFVVFYVLLHWLFIPPLPTGMLNNFALHIVLRIATSPNGYVLVSADVKNSSFAKST